MFRSTGSWISLGINKPNQDAAAEIQLADAREIDSTPMEGIDIDLVSEEFNRELDGYQCDVAVAIGYRHPRDDYNANLPKSRRRLDSIVVQISIEHTTSAYTRAAKALLVPRSIFAASDARR